MEYIELGSSPVDEPCVQVDPSKDYREDMHNELLRYKYLLRKLFPFYADYGYFAIKWNNYEAGDYGEVVFKYYDNEESFDFSLFVESNTPTKWSDSKIYTVEDFKNFVKEMENQNEY